VYKQIPVNYDRHNKNWSIGSPALIDSQYENNLLTSLAEIALLIEYVFKHAEPSVYNVLNVLPITLFKSIRTHVNYLHIDFSNKILQLHPYDLLNVHKYQDSEDYGKSLDKNFVIKISSDGTIHNDNVLYNYIFYLIKIISNIEYSKDIGSIKDYLNLADMNKI
jgi:hypothetical protein